MCVCVRTIVERSQKEEQRETRRAGGRRARMHNFNTIGAPFLFPKTLVVSRSTRKTNQILIANYFHETGTVLRVISAAYLFQRKADHAN